MCLRLIRIRRYFRSTVKIRFKKSARAYSSTPRQNKQKTHTTSTKNSQIIMKTPSKRKKEESTIRQIDIM